MKTTVSKEFHFSYGHRLINHPGKCANYHGHNARIEVSAEGEINEDTGMVLDFYDLNKAVNPLIEVLDHVMILQQSDPLINPLLEVKGNRTLYVVQFPPTAENLAYHVAEAICNSLDHQYLIRVRFWETPNCYADGYSPCLRITE